MNRYSIWRETMAFGLKHWGGPAFETSTFSMPQVSVVPELNIWDLQKSNPSGSRHTHAHESFMGTVGSGMGALPDAIVIPLDFNDVNISYGSGVSDTRCMTLRVGFQECWQTRITHMKVWVSDDTDFLIKDYKIGYRHTNQWIPNMSFHGKIVLMKHWNDKSLNSKIFIVRMVD